MAISFSTIADYMTAATTALAGGDYAGARNNALAAQALASVLPDTNRSSGMGGSQGLIWDRVAISQFVDRVQRLLNSSDGVQVSKVTLVRPDDVESAVAVGSF
jgi:hypothetical protein